MLSEFFFSSIKCHNKVISTSMRIKDKIKTICKSDVESKVVKASTRKCPLWKSAGRIELLLPYTLVIV